MKYKRQISEIEQSLKERYELLSVYWISYRCDAEICDEINTYFTAKGFKVVVLEDKYPNPIPTKIVEISK